MWVMELRKPGSLLINFTTQASFLSSLEMSVELLTLVVLLPLVICFLPSTVQRYSTFVKDRFVASISLFVLAFGNFCLGFAPTVIVAVIGVVVLAFGTGQDSLLRSMATEMIHEKDLSTVYSAITMLRAIGGSISGPFYAWLYMMALQQDNSLWLGLPYVVAGALFVITLGLLSLIEDPESKSQNSTAELDRQPLLG